MQSGIVSASEQKKEYLPAHHLCSDWLSEYSCGFQKEKSKWNMTSI